MKGKGVNMVHLGSQNKGIFYLLKTSIFNVCLPACPSSVRPSVHVTVHPSIFRSNAITIGTDVTLDVLHFYFLFLEFVYLFFLKFLLLTHMSHTNPDIKHWSVMCVSAAFHSVWDDLLNLVLLVGQVQSLLWSAQAYSCRHKHAISSFLCSDGLCVCSQLSLNKTLTAACKVCVGLLVYLVFLFCLV